MLTNNAAAPGLNLDDEEEALKDALSGFLCYDNWW